MHTHKSFMDVSVAIAGPARKSADTQPRVSTGTYPRVDPTMRVVPIATTRRGRCRTEVPGPAHGYKVTKSIIIIDVRTYAIRHQRAPADPGRRRTA